MTQERINKYFDTGLGEQLDVLYSTADDAVFIRHFEEAVAHVNGLLLPGSQPLEDKTILTWYREDEETI